ncbi:hypothetical protein G4B88_003529 [Cannabis sativa]|uniref:Uncharacterized protein n=2 Tax=Cannabis sativa TaxID=3483 RepID=A0AB40ECU7_CANSA|nr:hypothetical protein G4B88_003529 [Cannabis sativa]
MESNRRRIESETGEDGAEDGAEDATCSYSSSSSSSSIGKNSDVCTEEEDDDDSEAQSSYKEPLEMMESLEDSLPSRKGISSFYNGKSKSYTSLRDAITTTSSISDIAKPENAYSRRRRNLLVFNQIWEKNRSYGGGRISKRPISLSKSTLAFAMAAMSNGGGSSSSNSSCCSSENSDESSPSPAPPCLPPLHPQSKKRSVFLGSSRSFSLADLRQ